MNATPSPRNYTRLSIAIVVAAVVISASALSYSSFEQTMTITRGTTVIGGTTTSTSTASPTYTTTAVTDATNNVRLQLAVNITSSDANVSVHADVSEYNTLTSQNNVNAAGLWAIPLLHAQTTPCTPSYQAVGLAVAQGYYTGANISSAKFLDFINPGITYACTEQTPTQINSYSFEPLKDVANVSGSGCADNQLSSCTSIQTISSGIEATGYYRDGALTAFAPGLYTVIAADEWGYTALAYLTVT